MDGGIHIPQIGWLASWLAGTDRAIDRWIESSIDRRQVGRSQAEGRKLGGLEIVGCWSVVVGSWTVVVGR